MIFLLCTLGVSPLLAQGPRIMAYQAVLVDGAGDPYADGTYSVTFKLYTVAIGGSAVWTETQSVTTTDGVFSVILGESAPFDDGDDFEVALWLEVTQGATTFPRQKLTASPYAMGLSLPIRAEKEAGLFGGSGLSILNTATTGFNFGIVGGSDSDAGVGVVGAVEVNSGQGIGVWGFSDADAGTGVLAQNSRNSGVNYGLKAEVDSDDGFSGYFKDGRGVYIEKDNVDIPVFAQSTDDLHVASSDAVIGLYGDNGGNWGGGVVLGELAGGLLVDKWAIARRTAGGGGALRFTYGLNADYATNATMMAVHPNGGLSVGTTAVPFTNGLLVEGNTKFNGTVHIDNEIAYTTPQTRYFSIHGRGFIEPNANSSASSNHGGQALVCFGPGASSCNNTAGVYLPQGVVVTQMRAIIEDNSSSGNLSIDLYRVRLTDNNHTTMASVTSSGTPGDFATLTDNSISSSTIDNENYAYYVSTTIPQEQSPFSIYNVRIAYTVTGPR